MRNSRYIEKKWMQFKVSTLSASITVFIIASIPTQISASDIDIYQAGGTGEINIYYMLDASLSMGDMSLPSDYSHTASKNSNMCKWVTESKKDYYSTSGSNLDSIYIKATPVTQGSGNYIKEGNNYKFVGTGMGNYTIQTRSNSSSGYTKFYEPKNATSVDLKSCTNTNKICADQNGYSIDKLPNNLNTSNYPYAYAKQNEKYCLVKTSYLTLTNSNDATYLKRVKNICEEDTATEGNYICLTRLSNLKKGFLKLINSSEIGEDHNFAIGKYTTIGLDTSKLDISTLENYIKMNSNGKQMLSNLVVGLETSGYTPIADAYEHAANTALVGNTVSNAKAECSGNGIYFLTDGEPNPVTTNLFESEKVNDSNLKYTYSSGFTTKTSDYWQRVAGKAINIFKSDKIIKTATVGFGGEYYLTSNYAKDGNFDCSVYSHPVKGLCLWGTKKQQYGQGGFYNAQSADDIVTSIKQFVSDVSVPVEGSTMGTSTIPVDALNTTQLQPYSYFPMFKPLIGSKDQLWAGNLKKFKVVDGTVKDTLGNSVFNNSTILDSLQDYWYSEEGSDSSDKKMTWGGHLSRLKVHHYPQVENSELKLQRNLYVNINGSLESVTDILGTNKATNSHYLYGLLGFSNLNETDFTALAGKNSSDQLVYLQNKAANPGKYQMGSVIHSTPVLLTQKGALAYDKLEGFSSQNREDYILFGTTQGVLHVVKAGQQTKTDETADTEGGKEVFSFVPKEFLTRQQQGFAEGLAQGRTLAADSFFYGVDGPWVAHTEYEPLIQDTYKKDNDGKDEIASTSSALVVKPNSTKSHQYVYGGLRMGGDSYYALNLSDMSDPKLLFHIDPAKYKDEENTSFDLTHPLAYMGKSWSKPTITYIKWNGQKKLAMIVGGGYDMKYETAGFSNSTSGTVKGNGVYIFDAANGELLWWGSSSVVGESQVGTKDGEQKYESTKINSMTNSIPSRVKAIDRDGDGISDHLYVGDLGGKLFRIDLNPHHIVSSEENERKPFILNAFQLADVGNRRIYEAPAFTIHKDGSTRYAVVTLGTGDRSNPLNSSGGKDVLVGIYDSTVTLPTPTILQVPGTAPNTPVAKIIGITDLKQIYKQDASVVTKPLGWYFELPEKKEGDITYRERVLEEVVALDNYLYVSMFNPEKSTAAESATKCTGGITGESVVYQFCLPHGECSANQTERKKVGVLGPGILGLTIGPSSNKNRRTLIFNEVPSQKPDEFETKNKLIPQRWFEYSPYVKSKS